MMMLFAVRNVDDAPIEVDAFDIAMKYPNPLQQLSDRADDVSDIKITRRHLVEHRRKQKEVLSVHKSYFNVRVSSQAFFEV